MNFRSAISGRWVTRMFARSNPATTVSEQSTTTTTSGGGKATFTTPNPYPFPGNVTVTGTRASFKPQVRCSFCLKGIAWDAVVCPHCQSELDGGDAA